VPRIPFHDRFAELPLANTLWSDQLVEFTGELTSIARAAGLAGLLIVADQQDG
jgi:hypothetical protein